MTVIIDGGAGVTFPDTVQQTNGMTMTGGNPKYYAARAWVNFDGSGTVSVRAAVNVSSVSDLGVGEYRVNMLTAMPDANYAVLYGAGLSTGVSSDNGTTIDVYDQVAGSFKVNITDPTGNNRVNPPRCYLTIVR